jgi:hypothetical protein
MLYNMYLRPAFKQSMTTPKETSSTNPVADLATAVLGSRGLDEALEVVFTAVLTDGFAIGVHKGVVVGGDGTSGNGGKKKNGSKRKKDGETGEGESDLDDENGNSGSNGNNGDEDDILNLTEKTRDAFDLREVQAATRTGQNEETELLDGILGVLSMRVGEVENTYSTNIPHRLVSVILFSNANSYEKC